METKLAVFKGKEVRKIINNIMSGGFRLSMYAPCLLIAPCLKRKRSSL